MLAIQMIPKGGILPEAIDNKDFFAALSTQILNNPDRIIRINEKQYDYSTLSIGGILPTGVLKIIGNIDASTNPNYPAALQGDAYYVSVAGKVGGVNGSEVEVGDFVYARADNPGGDQATVGNSWGITNVNLRLKTNAIYVDSVYGDDATAKKNSTEFKYKTISAAQAVAVAGEALVMFPGTYNEPGQLGKNGLTYHFPFGGTVNGFWNDPGGTHSYTVTGFADMVSTSAVLIVSFNNSTINFQCRSMTSSSFAQPVIFAGGGCKVNVQVAGDIINTTGEGVMSTDPTTNLYVVANKIIAQGRACTVITGTSSAHRQIVYAKEIISNSASGIVTWSAGGSQEVHGKLTRTVGNLTQGAIHVQQNIFPSIAIVNVYGDLQDDADIAVLINNNSGILNYYGNISGVGNISVTGSSAQARINGDVVITKDAGVVTMSGGIVEVKGRLKNLSNTANAHGIVINGGTPILNQTIIVTTNAGTNSLFAAALRNAIVYTGFANRAKHANVTTLVGALVVDANVQ